MTLYVVGANHKTADLSIRDRLAITPDALGDAHCMLFEQGWIHEVAILSTCNRTEWYCHIDAPDVHPLLDCLKKLRGVDFHVWKECGYILQDRQAMLHMMRVASGLDSLVLGEPQILGQMKSTYRLAKELGTIATQFERLFQNIFATAKRVRTETEIGTSAVSVAYAAVHLAKHVFTDIRTTKALLVGAGDTIERVAKHLNEQPIKELIVANRTLERAESVCQQLANNGMATRAIHLRDISHVLKEVDIVFSSTASPLPIIGKGTVESALAAGKSRPLFMVDLAVPRDIESEVSKLDDVYLYTVDDLQGVVDDGVKQRQSEAKLADQIIESAVEHHMRWLRSLDSVGLIRIYRDQSEALREQLVTKALAKLERGESPERVLQQVTRILSNKMMHKPCTQMRQAGYDGRTEVLEFASEFLALCENQPQE